MGFKKGHRAWNKGKKWSEETKQKLRKPRPDMLGENNPAKRPEIRERIRNGIRKADLEGRRIHTKGKTYEEIYGSKERAKEEIGKRKYHNPETNRIRSQSLKKFWETHPKHKENVSKFMKELWKEESFKKDQILKFKEILSRPEVKARNSEAQKKRWQTDPKIREIISETAKKNWENELLRKQMVEGISKAQSTPEAKLRRSIVMKEKWKNEDYAKYVIKATRQSGCVKPNKPEKLLDSLIQQNFPNEYKLNVNADTVLNGKIPDFVNINGQKKCINFNGIYWHLLKHQKSNPTLTKEEQEIKEEKPYNELGYSVCFIWSDELKDTEKVLQKIKEFNKTEVTS